MLDRIINFSIKNKIFIGVMTLMLIGWGIWSAMKLPIDAVPDITNNQVQIYTTCPTLAAQEVEQLVTFPIEQSLTNIPDIEEIRSISRFGLSVITVVFDEHVDIYFARQLIHERLSEAIEEIPAAIGKPEMAPVSTGLGEVYQYIIHPKPGSEDKYTSKDLRTMQDWIVARQLYGTPGVVEVNSFGGELKQYEVAVDPEKLRAMGVSIPDVFNALEQDNQNTGGAYIDKKPNAYFIRGIGLVNSIEDIGLIPIKNTDGVPIFINDVADVHFGHAIRYGALTYNGEVDAVGGVVMMLKGENSNEVVKRIKAKLPTIQKSLPEDVKIEPYLDRTELISRAIGTVEKNLIEGALIVIFVLVMFLGNLRAGLIVASAIPLSMLFALGMMHLFGVSANLMSLGAIDFGLIVDGAVIVVEATMHHLGLRKSTQRLTQSEMDHEVFSAASKIRNSAAFGEIIILIVYIPILTLIGIEGKMFRPMAQTVSFAILGALILSLTYIPMMCAAFLPKTLDSNRQSFSDKLMHKLHQVYGPLLNKAFSIKYWLVALTVGVFIVAGWMFRSMGGEFIPQLQEGDLAFHCILPPGSSLSQSMETSMLASRIIKGFDEVKMVVGKTGSAEVPTDPMPPEVTDMMIILKPQNEWKVKKSYDELGDEIMERLEAIPGVFFEKSQPIQMRFNELMTGIKQDVAVKIFGENMDTLAAYAEKAAGVIRTVNGTTTPHVEVVSGLPQINIEYDRVRMANYGLTIRHVNDIVSTAFAGKKAGVVYENERRFDLVVRLDSTHRSSIEDVNNLLIPTDDGNQIPLSQVAKVSYKLGAAQISREDGKRRIVIGFNVADRDVESVVADIQYQLDRKIKLPTGYYFTYGGQFENLKEASARLAVAVPIALLLIFVLLYFTFHSSKQALLIFTAIPMSAIGGVFALHLRDMPFSISAGIGFIALFGVAVLNGIVLIGTFNQLEKEGWTDIKQRILEGTKIRLRPVLMTATVASLGFLPMAISQSAGAEVQRPLATVVIGGLVTATFLTLFVLPLLYYIFNSKIRQMKSSVAVMICIMMLAVPLNGIAQPLILHNAEEAVALGLKNNKSLIAADHLMEAASLRIKTAYEIPKLDFEFSYGKYSSPTIDNSFSVSQTLPFPTLFAARKRLAEAEMGVKQTHKEQTINELRSKIRKYFYTVQYLNENQRQLQLLDSLYDDFIKIAQLRFQAGEARSIDVSTAKIRKGEMNMLLQQNAVYQTEAYAMLQALIGSNQQVHLSDGLTFQPIKLNVIVDELMVASHPTIEAMFSEAALLDRQRNIEKAQSLPDITLGYTNQSLIGLHNVNGNEVFYSGSDRFSFFNIGLAIPLTYKATQLRMKSMGLERQSLEANAAQQQLQLQAKLAAALKQYQYDVKQFEYYRDNAVPNAEDIVRTAFLGYKSGDVGYIEYLYALQTATDIRLNYLKSIQQINSTIIDIYSLINQ
ncbi:MAG: CusA/CzcA family heavy metal efflux RND transporter [Saprospiraceae bacterium]|nr:MAG: CzcA family heavy metal efflux pump [Bacteroidetes bacterium OLB9]MCO6462913.1 CusA/CzcA family heavy metal efflux RND transporter [Saprospiraceae bacterium]